MEQPASHLRVKRAEGVSVVEFADRKILEELSIQEIGEELDQLVDSEPGIRLLLNFLVTYKRWIHLVTSILALPGLFFLFETADHGGELVYKHGVGVQLPQITQRQDENAVSTPASGSPESNSPFEWTVQRGDEARFSQLFEAHPGDSLTPAVEDFDGQPALVLTKNGDERVEVILKPTYGDLQFEIDVDCFMA